MEKTKEKKKSRVPHSYVILFLMIIIMAILTYVIPAGQFERVDVGGRTVVDPSSYSSVESNPATIFDVFKAVPKGLGAAQSIVFFIFIVGGSFNIITQTGAIEAGISKIAVSLKGKEKLLIPLIVLIFSIGGGTIGMAEEAIVFVPIGIALSRALGYDAVVGMAIVSLGAAVGFTSGFMNPFTVGVAQGIAEIPLFTGIELRLVIWVASLVLVIAYIYRYANKVKANPELSIVYDLEQEEKDHVIDLSNVMEMTKKHVMVLLVFALGMVLLIFGVFKYGWYITEIAAIFIAMGIIAGLVGGMNVNEIAKEFILGAKEMTTGAIVVGVARGMLVIMESGLILDSIVNGLASAITMLPKSISAVGMLVVQSFINFFIPSGSGQAATTMPIMTPLADVIGLTRQTAVLAYQFGDGISNSIVPTSGVLLANLSVAKIKYDSWVKFVWPLIILWTLMAAVFMVIATAITYGPF
ncbi:putative ion transporter superfamily protein YfcC [Sedimentibacter acidaminivorans]|uniref:Ion transporter superfamily protein YfcC n=1 Tax=Sedimentibacter acidaminivorans TaxID=913099 RepID=A0ABS4G961_9FIRM|nr:YfcC family protein [Sedimentibacter acidaminivorans]MBP1924223.1 putative ion transporter superfamily protein YfcC [Sedimentibacter acidaminivorans]